MAYFRAMSSAGGGAEATITVTYDSSFYNKTMTCTNGTKTYTKTTTSSGSTTFNVNEEGTWTITCNGVSRTVNVVLSYSTQMAITKTVTVYGAVGANISFSDTTGSKTVTLNSSGKGSVSITFIPPSQSIKFTDTNVAKNPNNLSQNYSKTITLTDSTTDIYVMPDGAVYWYGYKAVESLTNIPTGSSVTENTNYINIYNPHRTGGSGSDCAITFNKITTGYSNLKAYITNVYVNINRLSVYSSYTTTGLISGNPYIDITSDAITTLDITSAQSHYPLTGSFNGEINIYAIWLE